jgi:ABC-type branched-subunit amino acid transport system substrate-binding protein
VEDLDRRGFLRLLGAGGSALTLGPLIAACGSSDKGSGGASSAATAAAKPLTNAQLQKILDYIGPIDPKYSGKGKTMDLGLFLAYSGTGQFFGRLMGSGAKLAAQHIQALGGPTIRFHEVDHASGDPQRAAAGLKQMKSEKVGGIVSSYAVGIVPQQLTNLKMLALDPGAGVPTVFQGLPYFYGTRGAYPADNYGGWLEYLKQKMPDVKKIVSLDYDQGTLTEQGLAILRKALEPAGLELTASVKTSLTTTDFSQALTKVRNANADAIMTTVESTPLGYLAKNYLTSGLTIPLFTNQWTSAAQKIAGDAFEGIYFLGEYVDPKTPANPWAKAFVDDYAARDKKPAEAYPAEYYETTFAFWQLARDVLKAGGDINSGPDLLAALEANPTFPSVFGGDASTAGKLEIDLKTHSVAHRNLALTIGEKNAGQKLLATFDITGQGGFKLAPGA